MRTCLRVSLPTCCQADPQGAGADWPQLRIWDECGDFLVTRLGTKGYGPGSQAAGAIVCGQAVDTSQLEEINQQ